MNHLIIQNCWNSEGQNNKT